MPKKSNTRTAKGNGTIRQRKDGTYEARYTAGRDPGTGKQIQKSIYDKDKTVLAKRLRAITHKLDTCTYTEPSSMRFGAYLDMWLSDYLMSVKPLTKVKYETVCRVHLKPALGNVRLCDLTSPMIQKLIRDKAKAGAAPKSIKSIHGVVHKALALACRLGYLSRNPADDCELPRLEQKPVSFLQNDDVQAFLSAIQGHKYELIYVATLFTGMRRAEVLGLTWSAVDFAESTITISHQLQRKDGLTGDYCLVPLKNNKTRHIVAPPFVMDALRMQYTRQSAQRLRLGEIFENSLNLVFTNEFGSPLCAHTVYSNFKKIAEKIGASDLRFHSLRHTFATLSFQNGDDAKTVQDNLGHATASFTMNTYVHETDVMKKNSASRMQNLIENLTAQ